MVRVLNRLKLQRGAPRVLFCDNGPEFTGQLMDLWAYRNGVKIDFSRPGKPTDNAFCRIVRNLPLKCLDTNWFSNLEDASQLIEAWRREYNVRDGPCGPEPQLQWPSPAARVPVQVSPLLALTVTLPAGLPPATVKFTVANCPTFDGLE